MAARMEFWLWIVSSVATVALLVKFWREGLVRRYPAFSAYLLIEVLSAVVLFPFNRSTRMYAYLYFSSEFVFWILYVLVTLELYGLVLKNHPGIASLGRRFAQIALSLAIAVALLSLKLTVNPGISNARKFVRYFTVLSGTVMSSVVVFLLLIIAFLVWFPVRLNRNTIFYCLGYAGFFVTKAATTLGLVVLGPNVNHLLGAVKMTVWTVCIFLWLLFLNRRGETLTMAVRLPSDPQRERRLIDQLDAMNAALLRLARR